VVTAATAVVAGATYAAVAKTPIQLFPSELQNGTVPLSYIHESGNGVSREFLSLFEQSFELAYSDMFEETVIAAVFSDCLDQLADAKMDCLILCDHPEWCCELLEPGVVECPFSCKFLRPNGVSVFEISGAFAYEIN
jgi:hypothetical protein